MDAYKSLNVDRETYDKIVELAKVNGRTIGGQVAFMTRLFNNSYRVISITDLPHPPDAEAVPLVLVAEQT
ncbi:MAG: hypothetical protein MUO64_14735 [Anaerolineales bacterium]|nr:hypothetical protein [Anaerolineales bacterium]